MSIAGDLLRQGWTKKAFVPGPAAGGAGGAPPPPGGMPPGGMPPGGMDPAMGAMAGGMDPAMAGGGGAMPMPPGGPAGGGMIPPEAMMPPGGDPAAGGIPPEAMGVPPPGEAPPEEGPGGSRVDPETGETLLPMSEVQELLGAVTGKRAPPKEEPEAGGEEKPATDGAGPEAAEQTSNPVTPLGGIDPSILAGAGGG